MKITRDEFLKLKKILPTKTEFIESIEIYCSLCDKIIKEGEQIYTLNIHREKLTKDCVDVETAYMFFGLCKSCKQKNKVEIIIKVNGKVNTKISPDELNYNWDFEEFKSMS